MAVRKLNKGLKTMDDDTTDQTTTQTTSEAGIYNRAEHVTPLDLTSDLDDDTQTPETETDEQTTEESETDGAPAEAEPHGDEGAEASETERVQARQKELNDVLADPQSDLKNELQQTYKPKSLSEIHKDAEEMSFEQAQLIQQAETSLVAGKVNRILDAKRKLDQDILRIQIEHPQFDDNSPKYDPQLYGEFQKLYGEYQSAQREDGYIVSAKSPFPLAKALINAYGQGQKQALRSMPKPAPAAKPTPAPASGDTARQARTLPRTATNDSIAGILDEAFD